MILAILLATANLISNGTFDEGADSPVGWEKQNGLTTFWVQEKGRGRVLKIDSRIERVQALDHLEKWKKDPFTKPPVPILAKAPFYSSIGGNEGVMLDSDLIPVKKGQNYKLTVDARGSKTVSFVWIKGFRKHPKRDMIIDSYQTRLHAGPLSENEWRTFSIGFNPTERSPHTEFMKVRVYVYWPIGVCYFDNIRLEEITPDEMKKLVKEREKND